MNIRTMKGPKEFVFCVFIGKRSNTPRYESIDSSTGSVPSSRILRTID